MTPNQMNQVTNDSRKLFPATTSMLTDNQSRFNVGASISSPGRFIGTSMAMVGNSSHVGGNGLYTLSNKSIGPVGSVEQNFVGGNIVSPTLPRGPVQFFPQPVHVSFSIINFCKKKPVSYIMKVPVIAVHGLVDLTYIYIGAFSCTSRVCHLI